MFSARFIAATQYVTTSCTDRIIWPHSDTDSFTDSNKFSILQLSPHPPTQEAGGRNCWWLVATYIHSVGIPPLIRFQGVIGGILIVLVVIGGWIYWGRKSRSTVAHATFAVDERSNDEKLGGKATSPSLLSPQSLASPSQPTASTRLSVYKYAHFMQ